ncbi:MAG: prolipoprotein diacylglyceryl transferase [Bacillota bacterium]
MAFSVFGFEIYMYPLMFEIAFILGIVYTIRVLKKRRIPAEIAMDLGIFVLIGAIVGSRLLFCLLDWNAYKDNLLMVFNTRKGGLSFHGGFFGGLIAGIWYLKAKKYSPWEFADLVAPIIPVGYAITRIGCFFMGCCYGIPFGDGKHFNPLLGWICSDTDWLNFYHHFPFVYRYPTQVYAIIFNIIIFLLLYRSRNHKHFPGYLMFLYVFYYSIYRFIVEAFRESQIILFGWLRTAQMASVVLGLLALLAIWYLERQYKRRAVDAAYEKQGISG